MEIKNECLTKNIKKFGSGPILLQGLARNLKSIKASLFISQLMYWESKGADPDGWIYKTAKEIEKEVCLSYEELKVVMRICKAASILEIVKKIPVFGNAPILHFKLIQDKIDKLESK